MSFVEIREKKSILYVQNVNKLRLVPSKFAVGLVRHLHKMLLTICQYHRHRREASRALWQA
jgi:hypothetical protein